MSIIRKGALISSSGITTYEYQFTNETEVTVVHNLNRKVFINVLDATGEYITSSVEIDITDNQFTISLNSSLSGTIIYF